MSNPGTSSVSKAFALTGNPAIDGLIIRVLASAAAAIAGIIATWLNAHGFHDPNLKLMLSGLLLSLLCGGGSLIWGFVLAKINQAKAVQAGVNLVASGNALAADGQTVVAANDGSTPPKPVTVQTATQIVKDFAPAAIPKT